MESNQGEELKMSKRDADAGWERDTINRLAFAALNEQRRARRWSIFVLPHP